MRFALLFVVSGLLIGCKADRQRCEDAARNYATLTYWKRADAEIAAVPEGQRDSLRKKKVGMFVAELEGRIDMVVSQCQSANNDDQIDCMIAAKTADDAEKCADQVPND